MALTNVLGMVPLQYDLASNNSGGAPAFAANAVMDATAEKIGVVGSVWHPTVKTGTINIRKVHFRCGAITLNAASEVRVSLQNVGATAGPPYMPDGVQDQFYDFKTATTALTQNVWNNTGSLSADRAVDLSATKIGDANSRWVAVVWEFQAFTAADSVIVSNTSEGATTSTGLGGASLLNTGAWAALAGRRGVVALECDDGTFAFLSGNSTPLTMTTAAVGNAAAIRRAGVKFKVPYSCSIDRAGLLLSVQNGADGDINLYDSDGTTVLASYGVDNDAVVSVNPFAYEGLFPPVSLLANTFYRLAFVSSSATTASIHYQDVNAAGLMDGCILGQNAHWTQHDGATWADTLTRRPFFALGFSASDTGSSGGGGGGAHIIGGGL